MTTTARPKNRRQQILSNATRLFARHGYVGTSVRDIARLCDITEAAIYRHFKGKEELYAEVIAWKAAQHDIRSALVNAPVGESIEALLTRMATHILGYMETDPELLELMFNNSVEHGPAAAMLFKEVRLPYIDYLAEQLQLRMASGEIRNVDPHITSRCFVGMVMDCALSVGVWNKVTRFEFRAQEAILNNVPIFARGLLASASTQGDA
jgi:AcrR family transcriptional regulator